MHRGGGRAGSLTARRPDLHTVNHRGRAKRLADICLVLSIEETHLVSYGVKKLQSAGLVTSGRAGKEKTVVITEKGREICTKYREIRDKLLIGPLSTTTLDKEAALRNRRR